MKRYEKKISPDVNIFTREQYTDTTKECNIPDRILMQAPVELLRKRRELELYVPFY